MDIIAINTKAPNIAEEDKEGHSYIIVSNDIKSTSKNTYLDYESTYEDFNQDIKVDI